MSQNPIIKVGIGVIITNEKNEVLLGKRINHSGSGTWAYPGGLLELGETLEACAIREVFEETGLTVTNPRFVALTNDIYTNEQKHGITVFMKVDLPSDQTVINKEPHKCEQWRWFPENELPNPLFLPVQNQREGKTYGIAHTKPHRTGLEPKITITQTKPMSIGVAVFIINKKGEVLLTQRLNSFGAGTWAPPGGHLEFGETFEECAIREVYEEIDLKITNPRFFATTNTILQEQNNHGFNIFMIAEHPEEKVIENKEPHKCSAIALFSQDALPEPLFPSVKVLLSGQGYGYKGAFDKADIK